MNLVKSLVIGLTFLAAEAMGQINVTNSMTADEAVQYLLGPGVTYFNAQFTGNALQLGQLTGLGAPSNFTIPEGVVICTDDVVTLDPAGVVGAITPDIATQADLLSVAQSVPPMIGQTFTITSVHNVAMLEFDFIATGNTLNFNYIFGSDEYLTFVNSQYNDVFAFFLSGPGITGPYASPPAFPGGAVNIAAVPNSNPPLPITISSVNNVLNASYYIDNTSHVDISSNGYTASLLAEHPLQCGSTYHIRLAIADCGDQSLQSFVCFAAGSLNTGIGGQAVSINSSLNPTSFNLPENTIFEGNDNLDCRTFKVMLTPYNCSNGQDTIHIQYSNQSAQEGVDFFSNLPSTIIINPGDTIYHTIHAVNDGIFENGSSISGYPGLRGEYVDVLYISSLELSTQIDSITQRVWILEEDSESNFSFITDTAHFCDAQDLAIYLDRGDSNEVSPCGDCLENYNIPYMSNYFWTETFCPDINDGSMMAISVSGTVEVCCDVFEIYDGNSINAPVIFSWGEGSSLPGTLSISQQFVSSDTSGCITYSISPDVSVNSIITIDVNSESPYDPDVYSNYYQINWIDEYENLVSTEWHYVADNDSLHEITAVVENFCGTIWKDSLVIIPYEAPHILGAENGIYYIDFCGQYTAYLPQIQGGLGPFDWYDYSQVFDIDTLNNQIIWNGVFENVGIGFVDQCGSWSGGPLSGMDTIIVRTKVDYYLWNQDSLNCIGETTPLILASWDEYAPNSDFFVQNVNSELLITNGTFLCCGYDTISQLSYGEYHFQIVDELGCQSDETIIVWEPEANIDQIIGQMDIIPFTEYTYSINQVIGASYDWEVSGGNVISGQGTNVIQVMWSNSPGYINVECDLPNGCIESDTLNIDLTNGWLELGKSMNEFKVVFEAEFIQVISGCDRFEVSVYNSLGLSIYDKIANENLIINTSEWSSGVYLLELKSSNRSTVFRFLKT